LSKDLADEITSDFSVGMQVNMYRFHSVQANGEGLLSNDVRLVSSAAVTKGFEGFEEQNSAGFYVQEQIGWANRRFITGAIRVDDNSAFGNDFSVVVYPKLSGSWVISEESFFHIPKVDQLRLRAAYGQAGNSPAPFSADRTYEAVAVLQQDGTVLPALRSDAFGNAELKAETGREIEVGFDASLYNDRLGLGFTYYNKQTEDALISVPVPPSSGFGGNQLQNVGTISNTGVELNVTATPIVSSNLIWDLTLAASTNHNKLVSFGSRSDPIIFGNFDDVQMHREGYPLAGYWGHEALRNPDGSLMTDETGRVMLEDTLRYLGPSTPTREIGFANTLTLFKNWRVYVFLDHRGGNYMWNAADYIRNKNDQNAWAVVNPDADPDEVLYRQSGTTMPFLTKADFTKLREVSLTYTLPNSVVSRVGLKGVSITAAGRNLAIWTNYSGADPELNFNGADTFTRSDYMSVPMMRRFVGSVNITF
jgi:outer membrane receptor protein involved in Fe transport